ncbi:MAG: CRTAC1 family protein [Pseudomonadales bacterium]|nr:CRTAC1 family protein [Pseudomonadales bacterium]
MAEQHPAFAVPIALTRQLITGFTLILSGQLCWAQQSATPGNDAEVYRQVAESHGLGEILGYGRGASFVDIDGDGDDDLFVADTDGRLFGRPYGMSILYTNDGSGNFRPGEFNFNPDDFLGTWAGSFADFDNDGDADLLVVNGGYTNSSTLALLENRVNSGQGFVNVTTGTGFRSPDQAAETHAWWGVSWADYDNDGWLDVIVTRREQRPLLFHNDGGTAFTEQGLQLGLVDPGQRDAKNPVWIDYDGDGDQDLYLAGMDWHGFYENRGNGFIAVTDQVFDLPLEGHSGLPAVFAAASADFDQDGLEDLYLGRWDSQDYILFGNGSGGFERVGRDNGLDSVNHIKLSETDTNPMVNEARQLRRQDRLNSPTGEEVNMAPFENTMGLGVGDLFDDGFPDIVIGTGDPMFNAADIILCNRGQRIFQRCTERFVEADDQHRLTRGHGAAFADIDHDGYTEFFFNLGGHPVFDFNQNVESRETNKLFVRQTEAAANAAWIRLIGTRSNRDAVGARVKWGEGSATRFQFVRSTSGFQSQNSKTMLLLLGNRSSQPVVIDWPSGAVSELTVSTGQTLEIVEPAARADADPTLTR